MCPHGPPSREEFESEIVPELKTTVVQYVLDQEDASAFPCEDFQVDDISWRSHDKFPTLFRVLVKYRQKLKRTKEPFACAFSRNLASRGIAKDCFDPDSSDVKKLFYKNELKFKLRVCKRLEYSNPWDE